MENYRALNQGQELNKQIPFDFNLYKTYVESGEASRVERKHRKLFLKKIYTQCLGIDGNNAVEFADILTMAKLTDQLFRSFGHTFETAEIDLIKGMASVLAIYLKKRIPIKAFSIASNAIDSDDTLKDKSKQYSSFDDIYGQIKTIFSGNDINFEYDVFLADIDFKHTNENDKGMWNRNLEYLQSFTTQRLSTIRRLIPDCDSLIEKELERSGEEYNSVLDGYEKTGSLGFSGFNTKRQRAFYQMGLYSVVGNFLEENNPTGILFDVQKRVYPYEQPYYQRQRTNKLPIIRKRIASINKKILS
ncbi:MAG: hypothetical protein M1459_00165 [Patescibacteria group bacterium]|nr:hypothetical protein [Patescibacteria group bacterium]